MACIQTYDFSKVKCGENGLSIAERQSMHVASVAANAIVELFRDRAVSRARELHGEILAYSISHDHVNVKIHGHYARIEGDRSTLHRHLMREFALRDRSGKERWTTHHLVRKIYDYFAPIHLERIRGAIAQLSVRSSFGLSSTSLASNPGGDTETESDGQEMAEGAPSSKGTDRAKKPRLKPTAMLQQEIDWLKKEREESKQQLAQEREESKQQLAQEREESKQQLAQEREEGNRQKQESEERFERQMQERNRQIELIIKQTQGSSNASSGNESKLQQENEWLKKEWERQSQESKEQLERQRQEHKQEMDELKNLWKESLLAPRKPRGKK